MSNVDWSLANCLTTDADIFFVGPGKRSKDAVAVCKGCPIKMDCLQYACYYNEKGFWAGTSEKERFQIKDLIVIDVELVGGEDHNIDHYLDRLSFLQKVEQQEKAVA